MRVGRATFAVALVLALTVGGGSAAWAAPGGASGVDRSALPPGWELTTTASGMDLAWHASAPVPPGDAMVEFYAGDRLLGRPWVAKDQRSFHLILDGTRARKLTDLQVRAGGRRLDATADPTTSAPAAVPRLAAAVLPPNPVDPGTAGPFTTVTGEYTLPDVTLPGFATPVEMQGVVVAPQGTTGARPLVVFLHGRHGTCYQGTAEPTLAWPCPAGWSPVPSYRGYLRFQQLLASQGYLTVSVSANGINAQDNGTDGAALPPEDGGAQARSSLVRLHLGHWADWAGSGRSSAPAIVQAAPVPDLTKVLLFGHSRGGEGVSRAAVDSLTPPPADQDGYHGTVGWTISGLVLVGPTAFGHNPAPDVPSLAVLPGCDGDVSGLDGQMYADATRGVGRGFALHSSVFVEGANHNFFNTEWTPGLSVAMSFDDFSNQHDPNCGPGAATRLTPDNQQKVGATYAAAAAATYVAGNDQVRPLLDGSGVRAPSADPAIVLSGAIGGNRTALLVPDTSIVVSGGSGARLCDIVGVTPTPPGCDNSSSPNFNKFASVRPEAGRNAITMLWSTAGAAARFRRPTPASVLGAQSLAMRIIVRVGTTGNQLEVAITDSSGRRASLGQVTVDGIPFGVSADWAQEVRVPLTNAVSAGLSLSQITTLELIPRSTSGQAWLVDAWGWRPGTPAPQPTALPRVDLGELTVAEGNSGTVTYQVPARVTGSGSGQVRVFVVDPVTQLATATLVTVSLGSTTIPIPVQVTGDTTPGNGRTHLVAVKAVRGVAVGDAFGQLTVQDDDA